MDAYILIFEIVSIYALGLWSATMVFIHICLGCNANVELGLFGNWIFCDESNCHNGLATSDPDHRHVTQLEEFMTFSILYGTYTIIHIYGFVTFFGIDYDKKWVSQLSDDRTIVIRFMTKNMFFVSEDLLWHGIGDEPRHASVTDYERWQKYHFQWHKWNVVEAHMCCSVSLVSSPFFSDMVTVGVSYAPKKY